MQLPHITDTDISNKRVLVRADFDVPLNPDGTIVDDTRIASNVRTIKYLLEKNNRVIIIAKLGRPEGRDQKFSLKPVVEALPKYISGYTFTLVPDFMHDPHVFEQQNLNTVLVLENIRFHPEEETCDDLFITHLAALGDIYVNDAFAMSHRKEASIVGIPRKLPSYAGFSVIKEVDMISQAIDNPQRPFVTIMGGAKVSDKINLIRKLITISDHILLGGGLGNTFLAAQGFNMEKSLVENDYISTAKELIALAKEKNVSLLFPKDVMVGNKDGDETPQCVSVQSIPSGLSALDIGKETRDTFSHIIEQAKTVLWNGPLGYCEVAHYQEGTRAILYAITSHPMLVSIIGGGDTLAAIGHAEHLNKITHISTAGGAMLEFIEKGTLPGLEALLNSPHLS